MIKRVTLDDIAKKASVSKMAVSLALRDNASINPETRKRIQSIAMELGYTPNKIARGLASGKTYTIAAMIGGDLHDDYQNRFLRGATEYAIKNGYMLTVGLTSGDSEIEKKTISNFQQMMVEGYLVFHSGDSYVYKELKEKEVPFVFYTKYFEDFDCDHVICNDERGGYMLTKYFICSGHRRIAFVYDKGIADSSEVKARIHGYQRALREAEIAYDEALVLPYTYHFGKENFHAENPELFNLLMSDDRPTGIFVCNDVVASALYIDLKKMGFRIPEDFSVGGYEGVYLGNILDPPLTTVSSPIEKMGSQACKLLLDRIENRIPQDRGTVKMELEPILTVRNSIIRR